MAKTDGSKKNQGVPPQSVSPQRPFSHPDSQPAVTIGKQAASASPFSYGGGPYRPTPQTVNLEEGD